MKTKFGILIKRLINEKYKSIREFCRIAEPKSNNNGSTAYISNVMAGKRPPPIEKIDKWINALELDKEEAKKFLYLACVAHLPKEVQPEFEKLLDEIEELKDEVKKLRGLP